MIVQDNSKTKVSEKVYNFIIEKIKSNEWLPESRIMTEKQLGEDLKVSRVAVRQAIDQLVAIGMLKKKQGSGTFVRNIEDSTYTDTFMPIFLVNPKDMLSVLEFRIYFEYGNVRMFMNNCDQEDIERLEYYLDEMNNNNDDIEKFYLADFNFHNTIAKGTKNPIVIKINEILIEILQNHQAVLYKNIGPEIGIAFHEDILKAIKANDGKIAAMYMRRHIEAAIKQYKKTLDYEK
ncbi:MAG: GntR family transcriptional repressor for pyruvate dehydrogenase complex [Clostridium sp.]|jgi:GntR family transcriptional repressor for pyruvate dehydrogenase complex